MIKFKRTLLRLYCYPTPKNHKNSKQQSGMILIWVLFLLLIISTSSLALAKYSYVQFNLVSYYDDYFFKEREFRAIEREISRSLKRPAQVNNACLATATEMQPCTFLSSETSQWNIVGRKITEAEYEALDIEWSENGALVIFEIRDTQDAFSSRSLVYQISRSQALEGKDIKNNEFQVERKLVWTNI